MIQRKQETNIDKMFCLLFLYLYGRLVGMVLYFRMTECIYIDAYIFEIFYVYEYIIKDTMPETEDYCYHIMMAPCKGNKRIAQGRA